MQKYKSYCKNNLVQLNLFLTLVAEVFMSFLESISKLYQIYKLSQKQGDNEVDKKYGNKLHSKRKKLS